MPEYTEAEIEHQIAIGDAMHEAFENGDDEKLVELAKEMMPSAESLMKIKKALGADCIKRIGLNTKLADDEYGKNWLYNESL